MIRFVLDSIRCSWYVRGCSISHASDTIRVTCQFLVFAAFWHRYGSKLENASDAFIMLMFVAIRHRYSSARGSYQYFFFHGIHGDTIFEERIIFWEIHDLIFLVDS